MDIQYQKKAGITADDLEKLNCNLLAGKPVTVRSSAGRDVEVKHGTTSLWTSDFSLGGHLDVLGDAPVDIAYDMEQAIEINRLAVMGIGHCYQDYHLGKYTIYLSADPDSLFHPASAVLQYDKSRDWNRDEGWLARSVQVFELMRPATARFVGIRILQPGTADSLIRFGRLGAYNDRVSYRGGYLKTRFDKNLLENLLPAASASDLSADYENLTDGKIFDSERYCKFQAENTPVCLIWDMGGSRPIHQLMLAQAAESPDVCSFYLSGDKESLFDEGRRIQADTELLPDRLFPDHVCRVLNLDGIRARFLGLKIAKSPAQVLLDQIGAYSRQRTVHVGTKTVLCDDFAGIGGNLLPMGLMPNNRKNGFNEAYFELEKHRTKVFRPRVARTWFQVDWMEPEKGVYRFDTDKMKAFYPYLDLYEEAGLEIELNFAWKAGRDIQEWFSFHDDGIKPGNSAPRDLVDFAKACTALMRELLINRGYRQIKYLTFYNEPEAKDFDHPGNEKEQAQYYAEMIREVHTRLIEAGLRDKIKLWGPEDSGANARWFDFMNTLAPEVCDANTFHCYNKSYQRCMEELFPERVRAAGGRPVYMTEFGWAEAGLSGWHAGYTNYVIAAANNGFSGCLVWTINGTWLEDPYEDICVATGNCPVMNAPQHQLKAPQSYYEVGLLTRYIDAHSKTVAVKADGDDIRAAAFKTSDGDYTVVVEARKGFKRELAIRFDTDVDKTFYRFVYQPDVKCEENYLLPGVSASIKAGSCLKDTIGDEYAVIVYTTQKPQTQIAFFGVLNEIRPGESVRLEARVVDGNSGGFIWSVAEGGGDISSDGTYTAPAFSKTGDMAAIRVSLADRPSVSAIALIRVL